MENKKQQEIEEENRAAKFQIAQQAKEILESPLIKKFFKQKEIEPYEALKQLDPAITELKDYMIIHHDLLAILRLQTSLNQYIRDYELQRFDEEQKEGAEGI